MSMTSTESVPALSPRMMVTFRSTAFNTSIPDKHFISSRGYGGDFANWLINELVLRDAQAQPMIGQKNAGWLVRFGFRGADYDFLVRFQYPQWVGLLERKRSLVSRLFRRPLANVEFEAVLLMDSVLASSALVSDIRWHYDEERD